MIERLFPQPIDNAYRGYKAALWLFALVVFMQTFQGVMVIFNGYSIAVSADGIPLDTYAPAAAQTVVALFALLGLSRLILSFLSVLVLVRYRSAIPFMFAVLVVELLAKQLILRFIPIIRTGTTTGITVNLILLALLILGLALSLWRRGKPEAQS